jgi:diguanylate cyclase (GGDEF)-like protein
MAAQGAGLLDSRPYAVLGVTSLSLKIKNRLLASYLFAIVALAGAFGAFVYFIAANQVAGRLHTYLSDTGAAIASTLDAGQLDAALGNADARTALNARLHAETQSRRNIDAIYVTRDETDGPHLVGSSNDAEKLPSVRTDELDVYTAIPNAAKYGVRVAMAESDLSDRLYTLRMSTALAFLVCVLIAAIISRHLSRIFVMRMSDLAARCRALANNEPLPPRGMSPRDDFDNLALEFDAMAGRLRHAAESREQAYAALRDANVHLESRVAERMVELTDANKKLRNEIENRLHVEALLAEAALTDALTGLLNRRAMMEMLEQAASQLKPGDMGLSVIIADIDHFKTVNDQYGHAAGDRVLAAVGGKLRDLCGGQQQIYVARWGGEEFLILMPHVRLAAACKRAEQIRREITAMRIEETLSVSLSLGVSEVVGGEDPDACLRRCDQAMYKAKAAGRNTVVAAQGTLFATMS